MDSEDKPRRKPPFPVRLTDAELEDLEDLASRTGQSRAELIRRALADYSRRVRTGK